MRQVSLAMPAALVQAINALVGCESHAATISVATKTVAGSAPKTTLRLHTIHLTDMIDEGDAAFPEHLVKADPLAWPPCNDDCA